MSMYDKNHYNTVISLQLILKKLKKKNTGVGCHFLLQGNLWDPGIEPKSLVSTALAGGFFITEPPGKPLWAY